MKLDCPSRFRRTVAAAAALALLGSPARAAEAGPGAVVFFGDSLTSGVGVDRSQAYPALIQARIAAAAWPYRVVNAGLSGDTTSAALRRIKWSLKGNVAVLVIALGGNDGLRGIPVATTRSNLERIIDEARALHPRADIVLAGMRMPPNYGPAYTEAFAEIFPAVAREKNVALIPFLLDTVGGDPKYNLPDRIHPTVEGHRVVAATVWKTLEPILRERARAKR